MIKKICQTGIDISKVANGILAANDIKGEVFRHLESVSVADRERVIQALWNDINDRLYARGRQLNPSYGVSDTGVFTGHTKEYVTVSLNRAVDKETVREREALSAIREYSSSNTYHFL